MSQNNPAGKTAAIVSYFTLFGVIIAFYMNNNDRHPFASFHIRQSLGLWLTYLALGYIVSYFNSWMITSSFMLFFGILFLFGVLSAITGRMAPVPILGALYQKIFKNFSA